MNEEPLQEAGKQVTARSSERRRFLITGIYAFPFLIGGTLSATAGRYLLSQSNSEAEGWADAGNIEELQKGTPNHVSFERRVVDGWQTQNEKAAAWVVLDNREQVTAFSPLCTHLGCAYQWQSRKQAFTCPCHGSAFDITGNVIAGPAGRPLDRFNVKIKGSRLLLGPLQNRSET